MKGLRLTDGRECLAQHGHAPERLLQTGIGPVVVRRAKLHDRGAGEGGAERIRFTSAIPPRWARRTRSLDAVLPVLYLRGVSTGDFQEALWADGVHLQARMEPQAECLLVLIGTTPEGKKELVGFQAGFHESAQSWRELLVTSRRAA